MSRRNLRIAAMLVIVAIVAGLALTLRGQPGPIVGQPTAGPTQPPSPVATRVRLDYTPVPEGTISPIVVQRAPARGEALAPDGAVELVFDRAMDHAAVEAAFSLSPAVAGQMQWADARTLRFKPAQPFQRGALYDVTLGQTAKAADGAAINGAFQFRFATAGFLEVGQVIPADGTQDVQAGAAITVLFNRPVVPLTVVEQQGNPSTGSGQGAPQPLTFTPAIQGKGEWLNTAIYVFHPDAPLAGGTTYTGRVAAGLQAVDGSPLQSEYSWSFATARPQVLAVMPQDAATVVPIETPITIQFNQPIDEASARAAFHVRASDGSDVQGALQMIGETLLFTPSQRLAFDQSYSVEVAAGLGGAGGAGMASDFRSAFRSVPLPKIVGMLPADGERYAQPYTDFTLFFNAPIDLDTVMANIQMTPPLSPTQVYTYGTPLYPGDQSVPTGAAYAFHIGFGAKPSTDYAVAIGPKIADPYGNPTGQSLNISFHTDLLPPSIGIVSPGQIATYSAANPARIGLNSVNVGQASLRLYRLQADDLKQPYRDWYNQAPPASALLRSWTVQLNTPLDQPTLSQLDLLENAARLEPGVYLLLLDQQGSQPQPHVLVVSNLNLTLKAGERDALVWANDLQSGQPVPNLALEFFDSQGAALGNATTNADGVAQIAIERSENRGVIALAREPFAAVASEWSSGISAGDFGLPASYGLAKLAGHVYTDRPIYRPGQTVNFKGLLRNENDVKFSLPAGGKAQVTIHSTSGEQIFQQELALSANGSFDSSLKLADGAALGAYNISVTFGDQSIGSAFQVAAYRAPEFQVAVVPQADQIVRGTPASVSAEVSYFFGGPVASVPVQWNVLAEPYRFAPDWAGRYQFNDSDDPWRCWDCWWMPPTPPQPILSGSGMTDAQGKLTIAIPADLKDRQGVPITGSLQLTIEATATGRDNQVISGRHNLIVHSGQLYIGLAPRTYVGQAGEAQQVDLVTADTQGKRLPNQALDVEVFKYSWENTFIADANGGGQWQSRQVQTSMAKQTVTTDAKAEAVAAFTPAEGGSYRVVVSARDGGGRTVRSSLFVWVAGTGYVAWRRENNDRFSLIADKTSYKPGETADILIPSPFTQPHWALITVERGGVLSHEVRKIDGNSLLYRLPITAAHVPNVYVTVTLFSPPDGPGKPADFKVGILPLAIAPDPQSLNIALTPNPAAAQPGQNVNYDVLVTDLSGQPVAAELSLDLVDKAVLSLLPRTPNAIREAFYHRRELGISTASGLSLSAERFRLQFEKDLERQKREREKAPNTASDGIGRAGGDTAAAAPTTFPAAAGAPAPAAMESRADQSAVNGPDLTIREQFSDTAYWNANVTTDAAGKAAVQVKLPDNLTTWVMRGVGLTGDTRVGEGTAEIVASKPLLIRPVTPRFFVVGDTAELSANVSNHTNSALGVQVGLATRGLTITGQLTQTVQVPANGEAAVTWPVQAQDVTSADLVFTAVAGQYGDASRPRLATGPEGTLPVYRYSAPEVVGTGGQLEAAGSRTEAIGLPPNIDPRNGELTVRLDPSLAAGMRDGLDYLEHFDYECTEQTVSRFLPNVLTARALKKLGIANPELEARLPGLVDEGLNRLYNQQHQDGGWGWWVDSASNPHISAYVVFGLVRAKENGFSVREDVLSHGLDYLNTQLVAAGRKASDWPTAEANQQAWLLYVLGEAGRSDSQRIEDLYASHEKLSSYARAFLAMAMQKAGVQASDAKLKALLSDINSAAILSATGAHWEENENDWWSMNTDTRSTAIVLAALVRLDPANQLNPNVVRWLMVARKDGIWETTQESAWALMALTDWMDYTGELKADYDYGVWLNNQDQASGHISQVDVQKPILLTVKVADLLKDAGNQLTIGRGAGNGRLYYTAHLRAFLPVEQIKALDRGVSVRRRYVLASCQDGAKCPEVNAVKLGDVIRVELEIIAAHDLYYVQLEDPLPAGAEAIDTGLATTSLLAQEPGVEKQAPDLDFGFSVFDSRFWWSWRWYSRSELRDQKVALFADYLSRGSYLYSYTMRATLPGEFHVIPTTASELYFPEVYGRSDGQLLRIGR